MIADNEEQIETLNAYLGHRFKVEKENQPAEISRKVCMTWTAVGKLSNIVKNRNLSTHLKTKVLNTCILPVIAYGLETTTLAVSQQTASNTKIN